MRATDRPLRTMFMPRDVMATQRSKSAAPKAAASKATATKVHARKSAAPAATPKPEFCDRAGVPVGDRQVVLVLQGGGALGAYQAGVYEGLHAAGIEPDWVIGTSIGVINTALAPTKAEYYCASFESGITNIRRVIHEAYIHIAGNRRCARWLRVAVRSTKDG